MSNHQLYVHLPNAIRGPFTLKQMQQGAAKGQVTPQHQVSYDGKSPFPAAQIWSTLAPDAEPAQTAAQPVMAKTQPVMATAHAAPKQPAKPVVAAAPSIGPPSFGPPAGFEPPSVNVGGGGFPVIDTGAAPSGAPMFSVGPKMSETEKIAKRKEEEAAAGEVKEEPATPLGTLVWGLVTIAIGVGLFFWFDYLEQEGGRTKMNWIVLILYKTLGKYGVLGAFGAVGLFLAIGGALQMTKKKEA